MNVFKKLSDTIFDPKGTKKGRTVTTKIIERNNYRIRESIASWRIALENAESKIQPDRIPLLRTYNEIILDGHLSGIIDLRIENVTGLDFSLLSKNGDINEKATNKIKSKWFYQYLYHAMNSIFYGHSLMQINGIYKNNVSSLTLIPRENVKPESGEYIEDSYNIYDTKSYIKNKSLYRWLIEAYKERDDLGLLSKIVPLVLWKRSAQSAWAEYTEVFGMPIRIAKTSTNVEEDRTRLYNFVRDLGKSAFGVIDASEEIEFVETSSSDAFNVYDRLIDLMNKEMSKLILGSTMIVDDGASYSQSQVHQLQFDQKIKSDIRWIEFITNDFLIPKLVELKILPKGLTFKFDRSEKLTLTQQFAIDNEISKMYPLSKDYLETTYRVEFAEPIETELVGEVEETIPEETV